VDYFGKKSRIKTATQKEVIRFFYKTRIAL